MTKYINLKENTRATHLKVELYYTKGGYNVFTYKEEQRGYYLSVSPVSRLSRNGYTSESYTAFTGIKQCIKPVSRKSAKAEKEAAEMAVQFEDALIRYVCDKNGLEVQHDDIL